MFPQNMFRVPAHTIRLLATICVLSGCQSARYEPENAPSDVSAEARRLVGTWAVCQVRYEARPDSVRQRTTVDYAQLMGPGLVNNARLIFLPDGTAQMQVRSGTRTAARTKVTTHHYGHYSLRRENGATWLKLSENSEQYGRLAFYGDTVRWYAPDDHMYYAAVRVTDPLQ